MNNISSGVSRAKIIMTLIFITQLQHLTAPEKESQHANLELTLGAGENHVQSMKGFSQGVH